MKKGKWTKKQYGRGKPNWRKYRVGAGLAFDLCSLLSPMSEDISIHHGMESFSPVQPKNARRSFSS